MSFLGASTKVYKSYGRRKNHTTNRAAAAWDSPEPTPSSPAAPPATSSSRLSTASETSSSISEDEEEDPVPTARRKKEIALAEARSKREAAKGKRVGAGGKATARSSAIDKENSRGTEAAAASPRKVILKASHRLVVHSPASALGSPRRTRKGKVEIGTELRSSLKPRSSLQPRLAATGSSRGTGAGPSALRQVLFPADAKAARSSKATSRKAIVETSEEDSDVVVAQPIRISRRTPIIAAEESDSEQPELDANGSLDADAGPQFGEAEDVEVDELESSEEEVDQLESPPATPPRLAPAVAAATPVLKSSHTFPEAFLPLLDASFNPSPLDFTSFVTSPPHPFTSTASSTWRKIGEASYSEVFAADGDNGEEMVIKIIPICVAPTSSEEGEEASEEEDMPYMSDWEAVSHEIEVSRLVGGEGQRLEGFVEFRGCVLWVYLAVEALILRSAERSSYKGPILSTCSRTGTRSRSHNRLLATTRSDQVSFSGSEFCERRLTSDLLADVLPADQVYAVICLSHGGSHLEGFKLKTWREAASILWQVTKFCANAEEAIEFEVRPFLFSPPSPRLTNLVQHRDLHWGNVLIRRTDPSATLATTLDSLSLTPQRQSASPSSPSWNSASTGIEVTLIDFTLSRAALPGGGVVYDPFADECLFEGEGQSFPSGRTNQD